MGLFKGLWRRIGARGRNVLRTVGNVALNAVAPQIGIIKDVIKGPAPAPRRGVPRGGVDQPKPADPRKGTRQGKMGRQIGTLSAALLPAEPDVPTPALPGEVEVPLWGKIKSAWKIFKRMRDQKQEMFDILDGYDKAGKEKMKSWLQSRSEKAPKPKGKKKSGRRRGTRQAKYGERHPYMDD